MIRTIRSGETTLPPAQMIPLDEAQRILAAQVPRLEAETVPLAAALGRVLAERIVADGDYPPFDRSMMDGYAVRSADVRTAPTQLRVVGEVRAGQMPGVALSAGQCVQINTGAPVPPGADAVVPVERSRPGPDGETVELSETARAGEHVAPRGSCARADETVLEAGTELGPLQLAAAATVGRTALRVGRRPRVAMLVTGDELVGTGETPRGGQIRNSNGHFFAAALRQWGIEPLDLGVVGDEPAALRTALARGLEADVLITSGGISKGGHDLVPGTLEALGVEMLFRQVRIKPGKPTLFGRTPAGGLVFALPGNPMSCFVGMWLMVRPMLRAMQGAPLRFSARIAVAAGAALKANGNREAFIPARVDGGVRGRLCATPVRWSGSGDPLGAAAANAMIVRPIEAPAVAAGEPVDVFALEAWTVGKA